MALLKTVRWMVLVVSALAWTTIELDGNQLHGVALANHAVGIPFKMSVKIGSGKFVWYDRVREGDRLLQEEMIEMAVKEYELALSSSDLSKDHEPYILLSVSRALALQNRIIEAKKVSSAALRRIKSLKEADTQFVATVWFYSGLYSAMCGDFREAAASYETAIDVFEGHLDSLHHLTMLHFITGDFTRFLTKLKYLVQQATKPHPNPIEIHLSRSSFRSSSGSSSLGNEIAMWMVEHVFGSLQLYGIPYLSRTTSPSQQSRSEFESNISLLLAVYTASTKGLPSVAVLDLELIHFNLARKLERIGAWESAAWHYRYASKVGRQERVPLLLFQAALMHPSVLPSPSSSIDLLRNQILLPAIQELTAAAKAADQQQCTLLSSNMLQRRSHLLLPLDHHFLAAIQTVCGQIPIHDTTRQDIVVGDGRFKVAIVASQLFNSTAGNALAPTILALRGLTTILHLSLFTWPQLAGTIRYWVDPTGIEFFDLKDSLASWQEQLRKSNFDWVIFVDPGLDFRSYLLSNRRVANIQIALQLENIGENIAYNPRTIDEIIHLIPQETSHAEKDYVNALYQAIRIHDTPSEVEGLKAFQGLHFFSEERYYYILGSTRNLHPDFDETISAIQALDANAVVVLFSEEGSNVAMQGLWMRFEESRSIDLARVRMFEKPYGPEYRAILRNLDVAIDPNLSSNTISSTPLATLIELFQSFIPVLGIHPKSRSRGTNQFQQSALETLCKGFDIEHHCFVDSIDLLPQAAVEAASTSEASRLAYQNSLLTIKQRFQQRDIGENLSRVASAWSRYLSHSKNACVGGE